MKVLLVDQFGEIGGAQRCLLEAAMGFRERGWDVRALAPPGPLQPALMPYCAQVRALPCGPFASGEKGFADAARFVWQLPRQAACIARAAARQAADVIYVNGPRVLPAAALARMGRPLVYHAHWMPPQESASRLARAALRASGAAAIVTSRAAARWLQDSIEPNRIFTVYNGVAGAGQTHRAGDQIAHIAMLGRISPEKGQLEFARAARIVSDRIRGLRFTICGAPMFADQRYFDSVRAQARGAVQFRDWTEDVPAFLANVDLLVVPSAGIDNAPRVILEAFAAGVPVLAFASGAIPELIEHGVTGLLVNDPTAQALAQAILSAAAQPDLLADIAARAHRRWQERYTLRRFQSEICEAVEEIARRRHQRSPLKSAGANAAA